MLRCCLVDDANAGQPTYQGTPQPRQSIPRGCAGQVPSTGEPG